MKFDLNVLANGTCGDNATWTIYDDYSLVISGTGSMSNYDSHAPWYSAYKDKITSVAVKDGITTIGNKAFDGLTSLTSVKLPTTITEIGDFCFDGCTVLCDIIIPEDVISIGKYCFFDCAALTKVSIPDKVTDLKDCSFYNCIGLQHVSLPENLVSLGKSCFEKCGSIETILIPNSVTSIGSSCFSGCTNLANISLSNRITSISDHCFSACKKISEITIPDGVSSLGNFAFRDCWKLETITIPEGLTSIGNSCFYGCESLPSFIIPNGVTNISNECFAWCISLESVSIHKGVTSIEKNAFNYCSAFETINVDSNNAKYCSVDGVLFNKDMTTLVVCPEGKIGDYTIPSSVTTIEDSAFKNCKKIIAVTITGNITNIGNEAFYRCGDPLSVTNLAEFPQQITKDTFSSWRTLHVRKGCGEAYANADYWKNFTIVEDIPAIVASGQCGDNATWTLDDEGLLRISGTGDMYNYGYNSPWYNNSTIKGVQIEEGITHIGNYSFNWCRGLRSISIPSTVVSIGSAALYNCPSIATINYGGNLAQWCVLSFGDINSTPFNYSSYATFKINGKAIDSELVIPDGVTEIKPYAFLNIHSLKTITIPSSVTNIGDRALDIRGLDVIVDGSIPANIENAIGGTTFIFVDNNSVSTYKSAWPDYASRIYPKSSLEFVANTTATDGHSALLNAIGGVGKESSVVSLKVNGTINGYDIMLMRNKLTNLHYLDLSDATIVPEKDNYQYYTGYYTQENVLGAYSFYDVDNLRSVVLPKNITSIGERAFGNCDDLVEVTGMPESCTRIENYAFALQYQSNPTKLFKVEIGKGVTSIGGAAFQYCNGLKNASIPASVKTIEGNAFKGCSSLETVNFSEGLENINGYAFYQCGGLQELRLPASLKVIDDGAFAGCSSLKEIHIPSMLTYIGGAAFVECFAAKDVYSYTLSPINIAQNSFNYDGVTLHAPQVPEDVFWDYYNNTQWSQFTNVMPFDAKYSSWYMGEDKDITLGDGETIPNEDDLQAEGTMQPGSGLVYEEGSYQWLDKLNLNWKEGKAPSLLDNGDMYVDELVFTLDIKANRWYFFCFPFDIDLEKAKFNGKFVWRYYDGDERAANGQGGWKNVVANEHGKKILRAYQGYIFQTNQTGEVELSIIDPVFTAKDKQVTIAAHPSDKAQDASWNLVGNPNISYYDLSNFLDNFDKPITIWDPINNTYNAVMPGDDDYEFHPFEAFFVQKPTDLENIKFDNDARETYSNTQANAVAKAKRFAARSINPARLLVNIAISNGEQTDKTRVVFNNEKTLGYDEECDASKFLSTEAVPQIYTIDNNVKYAINERPNKDNTVKLGYVAATEGTYTISAQRMDYPMAIYDAETGLTYNLSDGDYEFETKAGIFEARFILVPEVGTTGVKSLQMAGIVVETVNGGINLGGLNGKTATIYGVNGTMVATIGEGGHADVPSGTYIVTVGENSSKVVVK